MNIQAGHYYEMDKGVFYVLGRTHQPSQHSQFAIQWVVRPHWFEDDTHELDAVCSNPREINHLGDKWPVPPNMLRMPNMEPNEPPTTYIELTAEVRSALDAAGIEVRE